MRMFTNENFIEFRIPKAEAESWPRLTLKPEKFHWLQTDWSRTTFEDSDPEPENERETMERDEQDEQLKELMKELYKDKEGEISTMKEELEHNTTKTYLICFNSILWCLFSYIFVVTVRMIFVHKSEAGQYLYSSIINTLMVAEGIQFLEVIHVIVGWSKGDFVSTLFQNLGRWLILFIVVIPHESAHLLPSFVMICFTWSAIEVIRYPYYILQLLNRSVELMTWLRYTAWIPLYPAGMLAEALTILYSIPEIRREGKFDLTLPNELNFSFNLSVVLQYYCIVLVFLLGPRMFYHMYKQSFKKLGLNKKKGKEE